MCNIVPGMISPNGVDEIESVARVELGQIEQGDRAFRHIEVNSQTMP